jgi:putative ABC transport system ATP-binding protein
MRPAVRVGKQRPGSIMSASGTASSQPIVTLSDLRLSYPSPDGEIEVLRGLDMTVRPGEILAVTGPSGSGKSSLIAVIGGLERPTGGRAEVLDTDMLGADEAARTRLRRRDIGIVFQAYHLVPAMTAVQNAALPLLLAGADGARTAGQAMLERVGLGHRLRHRPAELSGGEQQRVAIARAFVAEPRLILADEPTGNLDRRTGNRIVDTMFELCRGTGAAMLLVTHDEALARRCDRILAIDDGRVRA